MTENFCEIAITIPYATYYFTYLPTSLFIVLVVLVYIVQGSNCLFTSLICLLLTSYLVYSHCSFTLHHLFTYAAYILITFYAIPTGMFIAPVYFLCFLHSQTTATVFERSHNFPIKLTNQFPLSFSY